MKGFWNDEDGMSVLDILSLVFMVAAIATYYMFKHVDPNFADICIGVFLSSAGHKAVIGFGRRNARISAGVGENKEENSNG